MSALRYAFSFRWANALSEAAGYVSAFALAAATVVMLHGVASRYFFGMATVWQTEVSIYLLLVVTFWGRRTGSSTTPTWASTSSPTGSPPGGSWSHGS